MSLSTSTRHLTSTIEFLNRGISGTSSAGRYSNDTISSPLLNGITAFKKLGREGSDALSTVFDVAKKGALIATAAAGAIGAAAFSAVQAATQDQESQKKLADQLRRTMEATDDQIKSVEQFKILFHCFCKSKTRINNNIHDS